MSAQESNPLNVVCIVCGLSVNLETAKTDDQGKPIHEDCHTRQILQSPRKPVSGAKI
jgi:hypothetical protein